MGTIDRQLLRTSWREWLANDLRTPSGPAWLPWLWTVLFCAALAAGFTLAGFVLHARRAEDWLSPGNWAIWYGRHLIVCLAVGAITHVLFDAARWLLRGRPGPRHWHAGWRKLFYLGLPAVGLALGWPLGVVLAGFDLPRLFQGEHQQVRVATMLITAVGALALLQYYFNAKARELENERRATEAQLRLLQGQMEPHFLFNTLAGVVSLIDEDAPRARRLLQAFTDYLRVSLGALRRDLAPLEDELQLAELYLRLMQDRMEDRLRWTVQADPQVRQRPVPPLLLQPLVENAVRHGLEPSIEGGQILVRAWQQDGVLLLQVQDDGRGPDAPPPAGAAGHGMALVNLRERLRAHYGHRATLTLEPAHPGTRATLRLPLD
jgi:signal transduction histidine kinase